MARSRSVVRPPSATAHQRPATTPSTRMVGSVSPLRAMILARSCVADDPRPIVVGQHACYPTSAAVGAARDVLVGHRRVDEVDEDAAASRERYRRRSPAASTASTPGVPTPTGTPAQRAMSATVAGPNAPRYRAHQLLRRVDRIRPVAGPEPCVRVDEARSPTERPRTVGPARGSAGGRAAATRRARRRNGRRGRPRCVAQLAAASAARSRTSAAKSRSLRTSPGLGTSRRSVRRSPVERCRDDRRPQRP